MIDSPDIPNDSKLRIAILYALRYQKLPSNAINQIVQQLIKVGIENHRAAVSEKLIQFHYDLNLYLK